MPSVSLICAFPHHALIRHFSSSSTVCIFVFFRIPLNMCFGKLFAFKRHLRLRSSFSYQPTCSSLPSVNPPNVYVPSLVIECEIFTHTLCHSLTVRLPTRDGLKYMPSYYMPYHRGCWKRFIYFAFTTVCASLPISMSKEIKVYKSDVFHSEMASREQS